MGEQQLVCLTAPGVAILPHIVQLVAEQLAYRRKLSICACSATVSARSKAVASRFIEAVSAGSIW